MSFHSVLCDGRDCRDHHGTGKVPASFEDLRLDQVVEAITAGREAYDLKPFFYAPLNSVESISYRQQVVRDLEGGPVLDQVRAFARGMHWMRQQLAVARKLHYRYQRQAWFVDAVDTYCRAVVDLAEDLTGAGVTSQGLRGFREYLTGYASSRELTSLVEETAELKANASRVRYCLNIKGDRVRVSRYDGEVDFSEQVEKTFQKFQQGGVKDYLAQFSSSADMNQSKRPCWIWSRGCTPMSSRPSATTAGVTPTISTRQSRPSTVKSSSTSPTSSTSNGPRRPVWPSATRRCRTPNMCYADETFDIALANRLVPEGSSVVCNDFHLTGPERIFVVSGPNQGGKTTFARTFGQLHYLARLGCPVPGRRVRVLLFDRLFTHFEKEEQLLDLRGKLQDDLIRLHEILEQATPDSLVILNEILTSTSLTDAVALGTRMLERIIALDLLCVCVTFVDEWASMGEKVVSMFSTVIPDDPASRTYKIVRMPADGLSYAIAIADKYGLTYEHVRERLAP